MLVRATNQIGSITVDAVFKVDHNRSLTITEHAVEQGSSIADHCFLEPASVTMEIGVTDVGTLRTTGGENRSVNAYQALMKLQASGQPFTLTTRLATYSNMLIGSLSTSEDYTTAGALKSTLVFDEIRIVETSTVLVSGRATTTDAAKVSSTSSGTAQATSTTASNDASGNQSILSGLATSAIALLGG